jgi:RNA recognition motif-containing protein
MSKKLFVGNLPFDINDADLSTVLAVAGKVIDAKVIINKKTGRSKGYGFVEMETEDMAKDAVSKFEGATLNERSLTVQITSPKLEAEAKADGESSGAHADKTESSPAEASIAAEATGAAEASGDAESNSTPTA